MRDIKVLLYGIRPFMYIGPPHIVYINQFKRKATAFFIIVPSEEYRINGLNYDGGGGVWGVSEWFHAYLIQWVEIGRRYMSKWL